MKKMILVALATLSLAAVAARDAAAQSAQNYWSQTGAQCVVDDNSHANALYSRTSGSIKFAPGRTGTIGLFCSINKNNGAANPNQIWMSYQDTDLAANTNTRVMVRLFGLPRFGNPMNIFQIGTDLLSTTPSGGATSVDNYAFRWISHTFNFEANYYFMYVELSRVSTAENAILYGVALSYNQ